MPLNWNNFPPVPESFQLSLKTAATAFIWGAAFIIAPFPQLVVNTSSDFMLLATAFAGPVCGMIAMTAILCKSGGWNVLTLSGLKKDDFFYAVAGTFIIIFSSAIVNAVWKSCLTVLSIPFEENQFLMNLAQKCSTLEFVLLSILVIFVVPVAEELLFRRILFAGLLPLGLKTAWFGTAAVFAAVHLFLAGLPGLFVIGFGFQWLYFRRRNLLVAVISHGLLNASAIFAALLLRGVEI